MTKDHDQLQKQSEYTLAQHIEAILFWRGDPMSLTALSKITGAKKEDIEHAIQDLRPALSHRGIILIEHEGEYTLGTNPESAKLIEKARTEELSKDLGKAALETLAIVLYQEPIRRSEIDYIRGVNSNFILRNLLVRGLIERKADPEDSRAAVYSPSIELLRFMGLTRVSELPDFDRVKEAIRDFKAADTDPESSPQHTNSPDTNAETNSEANQNSQDDEHNQKDSSPEQNTSEYLEREEEQS